MPFGHSPFCQVVPTIIGAYEDTFLLEDGTLRDMMSGTSCVGFGNGSGIHKRLLAAMRYTPFNTYDYPNAWREESDKWLRVLHPNYEFAYFNGGAEAVEAAIKIARDLVEGSRGLRELKKVAAFRNCFHGKTFLTGLLTNGVESEYTTVLPYSLDFEIPDDVFAVVVEPFQCRNGVVSPPNGFFEKLVADCDEKGVIIIDDEISTSLRSGYALAIKRELDYEPDIICLGKNYGQGVPVSIVGVRSDHVEDVRVSLTSGFGGNPLACSAVRLTVSDVILGGYLESMRNYGTHFLDVLRSLEDLDAVREVRGIGYWFGIEFNNSDFAEYVAHELLRRGYIVGNVAPTIRLAPWFNLETKEWDAFVATVRDVVEVFEK